MALEDFLNILKMDSSDLSSGFERASLQGCGTPQEIADFRENYFNKFISNYFPFPHRLTKGKIRDSFGCISASIDCVVISPAHPYTIDSQGKFSIILADGVDLVVEVKPDISQESELIRGLKQIQSVKKLRRRNGPIVLKSLSEQDIIEESQRIPTFIFSMKAKSNIHDTFKNIQDFYVQNNVPLSEQVDFIIINGLGIIANYKLAETSIAINKATGQKEKGFFFEEWKDLTLGAFLLRMNNVYHAIATVQGNIINYYLENIIPYSIIKL